MIDKQAVERIIARVGELPAMPGVVAEVLRITNNPASDMEEVSRAIQMDPAMAAKILRVSNSSYYGMKQYVGTLKLALVILGVREVRNIVLGITVFETLKQGRADVTFAQQVWDNSLCVASVARQLSTRLKLGLQGEEFVAGLLSDIGKMVFLRQLGDEYLQILEEAGVSPVQQCIAELGEYGCSHSELAMALATRWNLPQTLVDALLYQYPLENTSLKEATDPNLAAVLRVSKLALYDDFQSHETCQCIADTDAWTILDAVPNPIHPKVRFETMAQFVKEARQSPHLDLD